MQGGSGTLWYEGGNTIVTVAPTGAINRFWRDGAQFAITKTAGSATVSVNDTNKFWWAAVNTGEIQIAGPSSQISLNQGSQAGTGFACITYVEVPSSELPV